MFIRYMITSRLITHRSTVEFTVPLAAGEAEVELADALCGGEVSQLRITTDLTSLQVDPTLIPAPGPNWVGFIKWVANTFDVPTILALNAAYVSFPWFCQYGNAAGVQYCITDAHSKNTISGPQYALFQGANTTFNLGMTLPSSFP